ncbi:MAG: YesL family protein [Clostridia bacterium]|nr:YesL family protein [Clostridia bacterium]
MGIFDRIYYGKAGKRDYSEMDMPKNRVSLFFLVLKDHLFDLIKVNLLQLIFWIPFLVWTYINFMALQSIDTAVLSEENGAAQMLSEMSGYLMMWLIGLIPCIAITGPSSAGAAYVMRNWARDQHAFLFSDFKDAFKGNWKQALGVSVMTSFAPILTYTAVMYYGQLADSNLAMMLPLMLVLCVMMIWSLMLPLLYPMMIGYELTFKNLLKNSMLMALASLPKMVLSRLITLIPLAVLFVFSIYYGNMIVMLVVVLYYLLFGFAASRLIYASFANGIFDKYLNPHIEGAAVGMGLRPQSEDDLLLDDDDDDEDEDAPLTVADDDDEDEDN